MLVRRRFAVTAISHTLPMRARHMGTTDRNGLQAACSLEQAPGSTDFMVLRSTDARTTTFTIAPGSISTTMTAGATTATEIAGATSTGTQIVSITAMTDGVISEAITTMTAGEIFVETTTTTVGGTSAATITADTTDSMEAEISTEPRHIAEMKAIGASMDALTSTATVDTAAEMTDSTEMTDFAVMAGPTGTLPSTAMAANRTAETTTDTGRIYN